VWLHEGSSILDVGARRRDQLSIYIIVLQGM